ncbi:TrmH family RNA methyltransferase [Thermophagus sp. OGC60D27]|uniref:TrmH family RNA methyltransferase n=1 Tax=Thermophagus sp. OGC60D27 TaxID=3458415 RepID=UPI004037761E
MNQANRFFADKHYEPFAEEMAPILIGWHLQTPENAGSLLRLAANVGCRLVLFVKDEAEAVFKTTKMKYVAGGAYDQVDWLFCRTEELLRHIPDQYTFVALETVPGSKNLLRTKLPDKMALMVGSERSGLPEGIKLPGQIDVHIPMLGPVKSMNVSHAAAVCLFEWMRQHKHLIL